MKKLAVCVIFIFGCVSCARLQRARLLSSSTDPPLVERDSICTDRNAYYPMAGQCDAYYECKNWKATVRLCPDGLRFKPDMPIKDFPCLYPLDVSCDGRPRLQPAKPTSDCPHSYGFYRFNSSMECGKYKNCLDGKAYYLQCPDGLAYNEKTYQCDWPDAVSECDVEEFLGFTCPGLYSPDSHSRPVNYSHPSDCQKYYLCLNGKPRLLSCGKDEVFDEYVGRCEDADNAICVLL